MGRKYAVTGGDTNTANTTMLGINAKSSSPTVRAHLYDFVFSSVASPNDYPWELNLQRITDAGTSTGVTPQALDSADGAAECTAGKAHSAEPTYTASAVLLDLAINLRSTFRFACVPGSEFIIPATASNGLAVRSITAANAFTILATILYEE